jgi:CMP-N-acetylneuraminic acid synthetase|tara:strand:- start:2622 stop:3263 length:642 start_codon:yes stop_codon:yes gene_type:complete
MLAILPIRAGSQRVKNKNIISINGKELYTYIVETLKNVEQIDKIIINTDYELIRQNYKNDPKIYVMSRDNDLKGNCNINLVIEQVLNSFKGENFIQTHATNPLLQSKTISDGIDFFENHKNNYDSLFSVTKIQKRYWTDQTKPLNHSFLDEPTTQNLDALYEENSCMYIFSRCSFVKRLNRIGNRPYMFNLSKIEAIDVDDEDDIHIVKKMLS